MPMLWLRLDAGGRYRSKLPDAALFLLAATGHIARQLHAISRPSVEVTCAYHDDVEMATVLYFSGASAAYAAFNFTPYDK